MHITEFCWESSPAAVVNSLFWPSGLFHPYQLDKSIFNLGVSIVLLHFYFIFYRNSCIETM